MHQFTDALLLFLVITIALLLPCYYIDSLAKAWQVFRWFFGGCTSSWSHDWEFRRFSNTNVRVCKNCYKIQQQYATKVHNIYHYANDGSPSFVWNWDDIENISPEKRVISPLVRKKK